MREVLVDRPDADFFHFRIVVNDPRGRRQRVVSLQLDHRPDDDSHCDERFFQRMELGPQRRLDAFARLVVPPQIVAKRLDDVIGGHTDVRRSLLLTAAAQLAQLGDALAQGETEKQEHGKRE